ncbi:hypothetical protein FRC03_000659 [Tulasnella sp. 419]|nr:hypothetical protein FRC03_000659 [Tulasnella sp. 419]
MVARHSLPTNSLSSYPVVGTTSPATPSSSAGPSPYSLHPGQSSGSYDEFNFPGHGLSNGLASLTSAVRDTTLGMDMVSTPQSLSSQSDTYTVRSDPPPPYIPSLFPSSPAFPNGQASQSFSSIPPFIGFSSALTDDAKSDTNVLPPFLQSNHLFTPSHNRRQSGSSPSLTASSASSPELPGTPFSSYESQLPIAPKPNPPVWSLSPYDTSMSTTVSFVLGAQLPTSLSGSDSHLRSGNSDGSGNILGEGWYNPAIPTHPPQQGQDS